MAFRETVYATDDIVGAGVLKEGVVTMRLAGVQGATVPLSFTVAAAAEFVLRMEAALTGSAES